MKLSEIIMEKETKSTAGVAVLSSESVRNIRQFCAKSKVPNPEKGTDMHVTVIFAKGEIPDYKAKGEYAEHLQATPKEFKVWPAKNIETETGWCLVLMLDCPMLVKRHKELLDKHKIKWDYKEYIPHLTLSKSVPEEYDISSLKPKEIGTIELVSERKSVW